MFPLLDVVHLVYDRMVFSKLSDIFPLAADRMTFWDSRPIRQD